MIGEPVLFDVFFATGDLSDYRATLRADGAMMRRFNRAVRAHNVLKGDSKIYVSLAHTDADVRPGAGCVRRGGQGSRLTVVPITEETRRYVP